MISFFLPAMIAAQLYVDLFTVNFVTLTSSPFWRIQNGKLGVVISGSPKFSSLFPSFRFPILFTNIFEAKSPHSDMLPWRL